MKKTNGLFTSRFFKQSDLQPFFFLKKSAVYGNIEWGSYTRVYTIFTFTAVFYFEKGDSYEKSKKK